MFLLILAVVLIFVTFVLLGVFVAHERTRPQRHSQALDLILGLAQSTQLIHAAMNRHLQSLLDSRHPLERAFTTRQTRRQRRGGRDVRVGIGTFKLREHLLDGGRITVGQSNP
jgi:hypothetical protein